jgi:hypothetical protein
LYYGAGGMQTPADFMAWATEAGNVLYQQKDETHNPHVIFLHSRTTANIIPLLQGREFCKHVMNRIKDQE